MTLYECKVTLFLTFKRTNYTLFLTFKRADHTLFLTFKRTDGTLFLTFDLPECNKRKQPAEVVRRLLA